MHPKENPDEAFLIDLHATAYSKKVQNVALPKGKAAQIALKAISIKHLRAGEVFIVEDITYPTPCQVVATSSWTVNLPMSRGIYPDAAEALLAMNHGLENRVAPGEDFKGGQYAPGFNPWQLLIAWGWSLWQAKHLAGDKWPLERRWQAMKNIGYPDKAGSFRQVCSRMNLSVTKSRPHP